MKGIQGSKRPRRPDTIPKHQSRKARIGTSARPMNSHCKRRIASIIVTAQVTPKIATNTRSPCIAARTQPSAASAESMTAPASAGPSAGYFSFGTHFGGAPLRAAAFRGRTGEC